jgi:hypothetical protein
MPDSLSQPSVEQARALPLKVRPKKRVARTAGFILLNIISCSLNIKLFEAMPVNYTD